MGWLTICRDYPADVDRREVYSAFNYQILHSTWEEGGHALDGITWLWDYSPLKNADKAKEFLEKRLFASRHTGTNGIAVRYLQASGWPERVQGFERPACKASCCCCTSFEAG